MIVRIPRKKKKELKKRGKFSYEWLMAGMKFYQACYGAAESFKELTITLKSLEISES